MQPGIASHQMMAGPALLRPERAPGLHLGGSNPGEEIMMRISAVSIGCLVAALMCITPAIAEVLNLTRSAESGVDSVIAQERAWDQNCNARPVTVTITKNPANGVVSVAKGVASTIPESTPTSGSTGACAGKQIIGNQVRYKSKPNFRGTDSVSYDISNQPDKPRAITINVK